MSLGRSASGVAPISAAEAARVQRLSRDVVAAMRRYATGALPQPSRFDRPPGVLTIGADEKVVAATPSAREWIGELETLPAHALAAPTIPMESTIWNLTQAARRSLPALTRVPTRRGWIVLRAQPMTGQEENSAVAVTIQPATGTELLSAMAVWHGLTPKERTVVDHVLEGLATKQIARRLELSPHTVNDHFKSIYRKIGVSAREELITRLLA
ncbi:helix-turn-helix transcriptional regulator [Actinomadura meridiana]|uniref:helix-turn-helix transcriptional regulator n=1 Tax=Actinomadura meridiana TaxID=559626 RepID=UPI0031EFC223